MIHYCMITFQYEIQQPKILLGGCFKKGTTATRDLGRSARKRGCMTLASPDGAAPSNLRELLKGQASIKLTWLLRRSFEHCYKKLKINFWLEYDSGANYRIPPSSC